MAEGYPGQYVKTEVPDAGEGTGFTEAPARSLLHYPDQDQKIETIRWFRPLWVQPMDDADARAGGTGSPACPGREKPCQRRPPGARLRPGCAVHVLHAETERRTRHHSGLAGRRKSGGRAGALFVTGKRDALLVLRWATC